MPPPAWQRAQAPQPVVDPNSGWPNVWPRAPKWPWARPETLRSGYADPRQRTVDLSDGAFLGIDGNWAILDTGSGVPGGMIPPTVGVAYNGVSDARGVEYYARLSNVIPDRAGRTLTYWAAAEGALHPGLRPMIEYDAPSIQTTIRRGVVLSDPYVAELRARGVIGPGVPASPPAWTLQGFLYQQGAANWLNAAQRR